MNLRRGRLAPIPTLLLVVLTTVTAISFRRVFDSWEFLPFFIAIALIVHGIAAICRIARAPSYVALPITLLAGLSVIAHRMYSSSVALGFVPTSSTVRLATEDVRLTWQEFASSIAPVPPKGGFLLAAALAIALVSLASDSFALRAFGRVEAVVPSAVVFTFVSVLGETGHRTSRMWITAIWLFVACVTVALLRDDHGELTSNWLGGSHLLRACRVGAAAAVLSVAAAGIAYAVAPHLPGATAVGIIHPQDNSNDDNGISAVSPLVDIRGRLTGHTNRVMFRVKASRPFYWHLTSLPEFDGKAWQSNETFASTGGTLRTKPKGKSLRQTVTIEQMGEAWVPAALEAVAISGTNTFVYNPETATVRLAGEASLAPGLTYTVNSVTAARTVKQLDAASSKRPPDARYVSLPDNYPDSFRTLAASITEGKRSSYAKSVALQNWFRDNFIYDLGVSYGSGLKGMKDFLEAKRGFCEQFASTFAAFARSLGIPARVAVGFTPGVIDGDEYVVRARNAHAWPEVWFDKIGWVSFEPTPGRGAPGAEGYTGVQPEQDETVEPDTQDTVPAETVPGTVTPTTGVDGSVPGTTDPATASGPDGASGAGTSTPDLTTPDSEPTSSSGDSSLVGWFVLVAVLAGLAGLVYVWLRVLPGVLRDRRRARLGNEPAEVVLQDWADATVLLAVLGVARRPDETPLEHAERCRSAVSTFGLDHDALGELAALATRALYARETVSDENIDRSEDIVRGVSIAMAIHSPRAIRLRLALDPRLSSRVR